MRVQSSASTRLRRRIYEVLGLLVLVACIAWWARPASPPATNVEPIGSSEGVLRRRGEGVLRALSERELASVTEGLKKNPKDPDLLYRRSLVYKKNGDTEAQLADLNRLIELQPTKRHIARAHRADILARRGRYHEALRDLEMTAVSSGDTSATEVFISIGTGDYEKALPMLEATLLFGSSNVEALWSRALVYEKLGRAEEAQADRERVAKLDPDFDLDWPTCVECHPAE